MRLLIAFACMLFASVAAADDVTIGITRAIPSRVLNETRTISIYLPDSYRNSSGYRRYPVLYVRDGGKFFHAFTGTVQHLAADATPHVPHMIVVAIHETDRVRDSSWTHSLLGFSGKVEDGYQTSGGGERFLRFLEQELVPYIDKEFSTLPYRIYCGYSFTGLSVVDAFLDNATVFDAFLTIDPSWWWDNYAPERKTTQTLPGRTFKRTQVFIAATAESYPERYFRKARDVGAFAEILERAKPAGLEWKFVRYADESHHSMALRALYDGLSYFFRGYKPTLDELYNNPEQLESRYRALSERLGERFELTEGLLMFFGDQFLNGFQEPDRAARYFAMAADAYPGSWAAWDRLAAAYAAGGEKAKAIATYERSLQLNPQNESARKSLQSLRGR
jgi:predicted alpha/beta superfamily hydrolase